MGTNWVSRNPELITVFIATLVSSVLVYWLALGLMAAWDRAEIAEMGEINCIESFGKFSNEFNADGKTITTYCTVDGVKYRASAKWSTDP